MVGNIIRFEYKNAHRHIIKKTIRLAPSSFQITHVKIADRKLRISAFKNGVFIIPLSGRVRIRRNTIEFLAEAKQNCVFMNLCEKRVSVEPFGNRYAEIALFQFPIDTIPKYDKIRLLENFSIPCEKGGKASRLIKYLRLFIIEADSGGFNHLSENEICAATVILRNIALNIFKEYITANGRKKQIHPRDLYRVKIARDFIRAHFAEPFSVRDLARETGIGVRSLQAAFRNVCGISPHEMINNIRLEQVRLRLENPAEFDQITTIAHECGFFHMGRFAQTYREFYGEAPSNTLKRNQHYCVENNKVELDSVHDEPDGDIVLGGVII